jgi:hypothetical protein
MLVFGRGDPLNQQRAKGVGSTLPACRLDDRRLSHDGLRFHQDETTRFEARVRYSSAPALRRRRVVAYGLGHAIGRCLPDHRSHYYYVLHSYVVRS